MIPKRIVASLLIAAVALLGLSTLSTSPAQAGNTKFYVSASHTPEECLKTLDEASAKGSKFLGTFEWGCMSGDHTGYAFVEAKDEAAVKAMLPASMQNAKIVKVNKFTEKQIKSFHEMKH
jgi:hypothetical protein